ncbi:MAG TPA: DUF1499 domain-containing protein [Longimicrobiaceae bacterium]|nr:DUF1499 domain-containing protein [Longimicrobiaceae bacterium]
MTNETEIHVEATPPQHPISRLALLALGVAIIAMLLGVMSGLGYRWGLWGLSTGFQLLRWGAYAGIAAAVLGAVAVIVTRPGSSRRGFVPAFAALAIGLLAVGIPWQARRAGAGVPPIHDITTDVNNPPAFVTIAPIRADAPNPVEYAGAEIARQQQQAYPDLQPVLLDLPIDRAFQRALDIARAQGWAIVDANLAEGRIEATDRTFWFGFYDDVVIRLTPVEGRTVVDVRSKSRVGRSDLGVNARRIRAYLQAVQT